MKKEMRIINYLFIIIIILIISVLYLSRGERTVTSNQIESNANSQNLKFDYSGYSNAENINYTYNSKTNTILVSGIDNLGISANTHSMEPAQFGGNTILLSNYDGHTLKPGEMIVFTDPYHNTTELWGHRVIRDAGDVIWTHGDNVLETSEGITRDKIKYVQIGVLYS